MTVRSSAAHCVTLPQWSGRFWRRRCYRPALVDLVGDRREQHLILGKPQAESGKQALFNSGDHAQVRAEAGRGAGSYSIGGRQSPGFVSARRVQGAAARVSAAGTWTTPSRQAAQAYPGRRVTIIGRFTVLTRRGARFRHVQHLYRRQLSVEIGPTPPSGSPDRERRPSA